MKYKLKYLNALYGAATPVDMQVESDVPSVVKREYISKREKKQKEKEELRRLKQEKKEADLVANKARNPPKVRSEKPKVAKIKKPQEISYKDEVYHEEDVDKEFEPLDYCTDLSESLDSLYQMSIEDQDVLNNMFNFREWPMDKESADNVKELKIRAELITHSSEITTYRVSLELSEVGDITVYFHFRSDDKTSYMTSEPELRYGASGNIVDEIPNRVVTARDLEYGSDRYFSLHKSILDFFLLAQLSSRDNRRFY